MPTCIKFLLLNYNFRNDGENPRENSRASDKGNDKEVFLKLNESKIPEKELSEIKLEEFEDELNFKFESKPKCISNKEITREENKMSTSKDNLREPEEETQIKLSEPKEDQPNNNEPKKEKVNTIFL